MSMRSVIIGLFYVSLALFTLSAKATTFSEDLKQVDYAIKNNPSNVSRQSLESCLQQRNHAVTMDRMGRGVRAQRALDYCFDALQISREDVKKVTGPTLEDLQAKANLEYEKALTLTPDLANGLNLYRECAACHKPEGWGSITGSVAQIAGQHRKVVIKQLADFRAGTRESVLMAPNASVEYIDGTQSLADVAAYVSTLEISVDNGRGPGTDLELGEKLYQQHCMECHGANGEGSNEDLVPRIQAQHYKYLVRMLEWIRDGKRRNASKEMIALSISLTDDELKAVSDYTSRLLPAEESARNKQDNCIALGFSQDFCVERYLKPSERKLAEDKNNAQIEAEIAKTGEIFIRVEKRSNYSNDTTRIIRIDKKSKNGTYIQIIRDMSLSGTLNSCEYKVEKVEFPKMEIKPTTIVLQRVRKPKRSYHRDITLVVDRASLHVEGYDANHSNFTRPEEFTSGGIHTEDSESTPYGSKYYYQEWSKYGTPKLISKSEYEVLMMQVEVTNLECQIKEKDNYDKKLLERKI